MSEWYPIETAPKDGTTVMGFDPKYPMFCDAARIVQWTTTGTSIEDEEEEGRAQGWTGPRDGFVGDFEPTHWMPLPDPPDAR